MENKEGFGNKIKRELVRAMLERVQSMDMNKMMKSFGSTEPVVYEDVKETLNVAYVNRDEVALAMDIFEPEAEEGTELPVIVAIHGGGLFMGDRGLERQYCRMLSHKGYLVFSLEYRLAPKADLCEQLGDVCAGMDYVGSLLINYDVDFTRIFLVADSAGAYLASYVSAMHESEKLQNTIGYKASRMVFAAVGFLSGMFYTNKVLQEQIYGKKRYDQRFMKYMNIEHPEIITNLPPAFMITSCGDTFNNFSIKFNKALKKYGRPSKLVYLGDEELQHVFPITNPEHPRSLEVTDKMLAWFEEQADKRRDSYLEDEETKHVSKELEERIADGSINHQKVWANIRERIHADKNRMEKPAVIDCTRKYTYEQMLDEWDRYARVFSALDIGAENGSRVALCSAITAEPLFALFGLNMTGAEVSMFSYPDFLPGGMWKSMLKSEKITDIIIADIMVTPDIMDAIAEIKEELGIRNVILMHSLMGGPAIGPAELIYNECHYHALKRRTDVVFMEDLLEKYEDTPIKYDESKGERLAFITHTSGTTKGTRKPLPFTDEAFNKTLTMFPSEGYRSFAEDKTCTRPFRILQLFDFSSIMALSGQMAYTLATGDAVVTTFFGFMHPKFIRAIDYYNADVLYITGFMVDKWMNRSDIEGVDFSSLKVIGMSGGYIPPEKMEKYNEFFRDHGFKYSILAGYGMSEAGGKPMFAPSGAHEDILGFAEEDEDYRIKDENDGEFYRPEDGPRTGILYKASEERCDNELDDMLLFEYTTIDGKDYVCTNDLVCVNDDHSISFAGRADKYFVNNEGKKFDSGIVDMHMAAHSAIEQCAVVPIMEKRINDTVPVLYVVPAQKGRDAAETIRGAFIDVYVKERKIPADNLPTQFMLVDEIPINANGKLDIYRITRERLGGDAYDLVPVFDGGELTDIKTKHVTGLNSMKAGTLSKDTENNSAYNVFDIFNYDSNGSGRFENFNIMKPWTLIMPPRQKKKKFKMPEIPEDVRKAVLKYGNRLSGIPNGRKWITHDFED